MAAPKGNKFWQCRAKHGRNGIWSNPDDLWEDCVGYFQWAEKNPLWESKATQYQGQVVEMILPKMRAMTISGLCIHLGISRQGWHEYRQKEDFSAICERVEDIIRDQKFSGAAADLLNPSIIARDLGLRDGVDNHHSGSLDVNSMTEHSLNEELMNLIRASQVE